MSTSKKTKANSTNRREFLTRVGLGSLAVVGLSSCNKLPQVVFKKKRSKGKPSDKEIESLLEATEEIESAVKTLNKFKQSFRKMKNPPAKLESLVSKEALQKIIDSQRDYLYSFYKSNFTSGEVQELLEIYQSKVWQKLMDVRTANAASPTEKAKMPIAQFMIEVQSKLQHHQKISDSTNLVKSDISDE